MKSNLSFLFRQSTESYVRLSLQTYTACVMWCDISRTFRVKFLKKIKRLFTAHTVKAKSYVKTWTDEDQLTTCVQVVPGEVSLLWQEGSHCWVISQDRNCRHPFYKVSIQWKQFILPFLSHFWSTQNNGKTIKTNGKKATCKRLWVKYHSYFLHWIRPVYFYALGVKCTLWRPFLHFYVWPVRFYAFWWQGLQLWVMYDRFVW